LRQNTEAQVCFERLRALLKDRNTRGHWWKQDADVQAFVREAEELVPRKRP
jgi:hypothetical protein